MISRRIFHHLTTKHSLVFRTHQRSVHLGLCRLNSDDQFKNDPDIKQIVKDIHSDFDDKPSNNEDEMKKDDSSSKKSVSELLSELYGEDNVKQDSTKDKFSSVGGYVEYVDADSDVIYDIDEEREILRKAYLEGKTIDIGKRKKTSPAEKYSYMSKTRGERGVFELEEIVELLNNEKIVDLAVIKIPAERKYADHMVIGTANSDRHLRTVSSLIVSVFKRKMWLSDPVPRVEGAQDKQCGWNALDLGNIVVHLLTQEQREYYDLETLWSVGAEYDDNSRQYDNISSTGHLSTLEELMKTDFDLSLLDHDKSDVKESSN